MENVRTIELDKENRKTKHSRYWKIPSKSNENVVNLAAPHIDSFNFLIDQGLQLAIQSTPSIQFALPSGDKLSILIQDIEIGKPQVSKEFGETTDLNMYPKECIEAGSTYQATITGTIMWFVNDRTEEPFTLNMGEIPIMVKSKRCNLYGMNPEELVRHGEIVNETGGYFIINGVCRVLRLLIANRRNYPIAMLRPSWKERDNNIAEKGVFMRCVGADETNYINILHHMTTGGVKVEIQVEKDFYLLPLLLAMKILVNYSDRFIHLSLIRGREHDNYYSEKIKMMMREMQGNKFYNQDSCKEYVGGTFRAKFAQLLPVWMTDEEVCDYLFDNHLLIHLETPKQKFETLCMMTRKLYAFVGGECAPETVDAVSMQEAALGGHTYLQILKEKIKQALNEVKLRVLSKCRDKGELFRLDSDFIRKSCKVSVKVGESLKTFIATGSIPHKTRCGVMQKTGLTVLMERLNRMRDLSHLRAIHRGSYFLDMKTIGPRRLTGEAWGFICPVHTPDGAPCGLLNHLAYRCIITCDPTQPLSSLTQSLSELGMTPYDSMPLTDARDFLEVIVDGNLVGYIPKAGAKTFESRLRGKKIAKKIYEYTEIVLIEDRAKGQYPALFLHTSPARMMRPVVNLEHKAKEYVGTFEQLYMNVAISPKDFDEWVYTKFSHCEIEKLSMLSNIARLVPFSDCNPNPRNMYQCQMGKQTMGTPIHNWNNQTYQKLYRLQYPQIPLSRNKHYDDINMEEFCMGFNAVVAIVSYTGFDMEDAMILNKCSMERGLAHGQVYKSEFVDLVEGRKQGYRTLEVKNLFKRDPSKVYLEKFLDENGLPYPGTQLSEGDPYYCVYDVDQNTYKIVKYKGEDCVVDKYSLINTQSPKLQELQKVNITLRIRRDPIIGDKFASRSGQKGVMSRLYPMEDLPFSERGITPDIIFNPHGIPSRMTAGTLIDLLAGKCAAEFGKAFDSSPFTFDDENPPFDYFGKILEKAGFNYYGEDVLYSGVDGRMMEVSVFEGIIYYQRLRHMTADKWQVRSTGAMDILTHQPIKGRKRGGAIRFGEMERDCLIAHGASYTLKDRILDCSDLTTELVCSNCGSILSPTAADLKYRNKGFQCGLCGPDYKLRKVQMPYAFKFLINEFAAFGLCIKLGTKTVEVEGDRNNNNNNIPVISKIVLHKDA